MRRSAAIALLIAGIALPACTQRGGARGGFSSHPSQGFHGGFTGSAPSGFSGNHFAVPSPGPSFRTAPSYARPGFGTPYARQPYNGAGRYPGSQYPGNHYGRPYDRGQNRHVYVWRNGAWSSYLVPGYAWPGYWGYPDTGYYDDSAASAGSATPAYDVQPEQQEESQPREPYYPSIGPSNPSPAPQSEDAVMVVFKDRRPPLEVHNYALTPTTLYVLDQRRRDIPVAEIDLAATQKVNRDAGIDFQFPVASR